MRCGSIYTDCDRGQRKQRRRERRKRGTREERARLHLPFAPQHGQQDDARGPEDLEALERQGRVLPHAGLAAVGRRRRREDREREEAVDRVEGDAEEVVEEPCGGGVQSAQGEQSRRRSAAVVGPEKRRGDARRQERHGAFDAVAAALKVLEAARLEHLEVLVCGIRGRQFVVRAE